jgi:hypothetical protein
MAIAQSLLWLILQEQCHRSPVSLPGFVNLLFRVRTIQLL